MTNWFSISKNTGVAICTSVFFVLGKFCQSLMPDIQELHRETRPESDELIQQWSGLWRGATRFTIRPVRVNQRDNTANDVSIRWQVIDNKALDYVSSASAAMWSLLCQRKVGDPDSNNKLSVKNKSTEVPVGISVLFYCCHLNENNRWRNCITQ